MMRRPLPNVRLIGAILVFLFFTGQGASPQNRVLELDGNGSYVELPRNLFEGLREFTFEGWFKWTSFPFRARAIAFGTGDHELRLGNFTDTAGFNCTLRLPPGSTVPKVSFRVAHLLQRNEWCHLAVTMDRDSLRLYFNGCPVGSGLVPASYTGLPASGPNTIGFGRYANDPGAPFHGQMDELRLWKRARSVAEIRASMFARLNGRDEGLLGLWNFDAANANDSSLRDARGLMHGNARTILAAHPAPGDLAQPAVIRGRFSEPATGLEVRREQDGVTVAQGLMNLGVYEVIVFRPNSSPYDLALTWANRRTRRSHLLLTAGQTHEVNLTLSEAGNLTGTLRMFDGTPHVAVPVQVVDASHRVLATALTDEQGNYRLEKIKAGSYFLRMMVRDGFEYFVEPNKSVFVSAEESPRSKVQGR